MQKKQIPVAMPEWMIDGLKNLSNESSLPLAELVRRAVAKHYKLKEPKIGG